jgi:cytochrome c
MYIEKLGLAFHLKCFRCSVCHQPLGNGLEGTTAYTATAASPTT